MILVDKRIGSKHLINYLPPNSSMLDSLKFGDVAFLGRGIEGAPVRIGIELKTLSDACGSLMSGRLGGHQLPGMMETYDKCYLIVEGIYRCGKQGELEVPKNKNGKTVWEMAQWGKLAWMYSELDNWFTTLATVAGVIVKRSTSRRETAAIIYNLHQWWNNKDLDQHRSHVGFDRSGRPTLIKPRLVKRIAAELPLIGWERAGAVAEYFPNVRAMINAPRDTWMKIEGIGPKIAARVVEAVSKDGE